MAARAAEAGQEGRAKDEKGETEGEQKKKEKKKDAGSDLIIRDLTTGQNATVTEVTEYAWAKDGAWIAYAVSSKTPEKDGVFARQTSDASTRALMTGKGHYNDYYIVSLRDGTRTRIVERSAFGARLSPGEGRAIPRSRAP